MNGVKSETIYKVFLSENAKSFYNSSNPQLAKKLSRCFKYLEINPFNSNNIKRLSGKLMKYFRYRVGDYRVIYRVDENKKEIFVILIKHRADAYK